ncbi:MAG: hypothetical protein JWN67_5333 [Actinomycetia bacterium]|nr:hypothetical protein [Actinomycetes bacterium]
MHAALVEVSVAGVDREDGISSSFISPVREAPGFAGGR